MTTTDLEEEYTPLWSFVSRVLGEGANDGVRLRFDLLLGDHNQKHHLAVLVVTPVATTADDVVQWIFEKAGQNMRDEYTKIRVNIQNAATRERYGSFLHTLGLENDE